MRDIKFRGKRIDNEEWVYGWLRPLWQAVDSPERWAIIDSSHTVFKNDGWTIADGELEVHPETVGQFTGLTDKNGDWYAGDIFEDAVGRIWFIEYNEKNAMFLFCWHKDPKQKQPYRRFNKKQRPLTKIGNIHENPELLTGE